MKNPSRIPMLLSCVLVAVSVLVGCASSEAGEMSDQQKIDTMKKAHDTRIVPPAGTGAPATGG